MRDQCPQRLLRVTDERDVGRVADADHPGVAVDLDAARLPLLRQELRVREARADHEQRVAAHEHVVARDRPEQADGAGHVRQVVGEDVLAEQRLGDACAEQLRSLFDLLRGAARTLADEDRDLLPLVEDLGRVLDVRVLRQDARPRVAHARVHRAVRARRRRDRLRLLHVVREHERAHTLAVEGDAQRAVDEMPRLRGLHARLHVFGDVLEQHLQVDLLLVRGPDGAPLLLPDDGDDRRVVELRVVEAVQQMDRARAGGGHADADGVGAGELGVPARHERGHLLVPCLDELGIALRAVERAEEPVDPVAGIPVDAVDAPLAEACENEV